MKNIRSGDYYINEQLYTYLNNKWIETKSEVSLNVEMAIIGFGGTGFGIVFLE